MMQLEDDHAVNNLNPWGDVSVAGAIIFMTKTIRCFA